MSKYKLSIGAIFKNDQHAIKEWIKHYNYHMASHFYLINDSSTDNSLQILEPYIKKGVVTLFSAINWPQYEGRETDMYNHFILPIIKETKWLLLCDLDEFMWSPQSIHLTYILDEFVDVGQIQVENTIFGSNGYIEQPKSIVYSFTKRGKRPNTLINGLGNKKYFINTSFNFKSLDINRAIFENTYEKNKTITLNYPYFVLNHYIYQSYEFWANKNIISNNEDFFLSDLNETENFELLNLNSNKYIDNGLYEQNKGICFEINGHF
jgi:hypothetical protein